MENSYELNAFIQENDETKPFSLKISAPTQSPDEDYFCSIHAPELFKKDKVIHGVDAKQAKELAINFVKSMLAGKQIVDKEGRPVSI
jgi:hypothetical protein